MRRWSWTPGPARSSTRRMPIPALHPASLTKMMTLYIVFDEIRRGRLSLDQKVTISANAAAEPPSRLGLRAGQQIELRYLIRAAAIKSANDAATALGEAVAGSEAAFAGAMNAYARAMGMKNTSFKNANGLTADGPSVHRARHGADRPPAGLRLPAILQHLRPHLDLGRGSDGAEHQPPPARRLSGRRRHQDRLYPRRRLQPRLLGPARRQAGDRRRARRPDQRRAQRRGRPADGRRLRARCRARARFVPARRRCASRSPPPIAASRAPGHRRCRGGRTLGSRRRRRRRRRHAFAARHRIAATVRCRARSPAAASLATASQHRRRNRRGERRTRRRRGRRSPALPCVIGRPMPRPEARPSAPTMPRPAPPRPDRLDLRVARAGAPLGLRRCPSDRIQVAEAGTPAPPAAATGAQLGAFRAKGDAERQLLTTALMDVPAAQRRPAPRRGRPSCRASRSTAPSSSASAACERWAPARRSRGRRPTAFRWRPESDRGGPQSLRTVAAPFPLPLPFPSLFLSRPNPRCAAPAARAEQPNPRDADAPLSPAGGAGRTLRFDPGVRPAGHRPARSVLDVAELVAGDRGEAPFGDVDHRQILDHQPLEVAVERHPFGLVHRGAAGGDDGVELGIGVAALVGEAAPPPAGRSRPGSWSRSPGRRGRPAARWPGRRRGRCRPPAGGRRCRC